jgi:hypothetical protein
MNYIPLDFARSALQGDLFNEASDPELAHDESGTANNTEHASDRRPQGIFGRLADRAFARSESCAADHEPYQSDPKPNVNTLHDLELLLKDGQHNILREGVAINFSSPHIGSAVLFEATRVGSDASGATQVRYLPLVNKGARTTAQPGSGTAMTPQARLLQVIHTHANVPNRPNRPLPSIVQIPTPTPTGPIAKDRPLDISPDAKRYIDRARAQRSLVGAVTTNSNIASSIVPSRHVSSRSNTMSTPVGQWPPDAIPVELFATITRTLSHRDVRNMRLVCKEFESKTSGVLFKEVVVPFTAELYDMIEEDVSTRLSSQSKPESSKRTTAQASSLRVPDLHRENGDGMYYRKASDTATTHGLRVFEGFGPHMNKFGIRFEVTEADLSMAPSKSSNTRHVQAYHGGYEWPPPGYARFGSLASLERVADETPRMTAALATLVNVREIGLSLDSGLGFLSGPDHSHHDMVFERSAKVFEDDEPSLRHTSNGAGNLWSYVRQSHSSFTTGVQLGQERLVSCILMPDRNGSVQLPTVASGIEYGDSTLWPSFETDGILCGVNLATPVSGVFYTTSAELNTSNNSAREGQPPLSPASLTSEQKQWILETGWAQSAFLDTYILALVDNPQVFQHITKVTISKISSGLLSQLDRDPFWTALPNVEDVTLLVSPDWRTVGKDEAGCAVTHPIAPSLAVSTFVAVVRRVIILDEIKRLRIGYAQGGENAKGMYGRNHNLMPAPISGPGQLLKPDPDVLAFDHLEAVTLVNCWISPQALLHLASTQTIAAVSGKTLTLESVSLTASTKLELQNFLQVKVGTMQQFREGCWPWVIEGLRRALQPIPREPDPFTASSEPQFDPAPYKRITSSSCGYVILPNLAGFDQSAIELGPTMIPAQLGPEHTVYITEWFRQRAEQLRGHMQTTKDDYVGRIVPWINAREIAVLNTWRMRVGLPSDEDGSDAEYDGFPTRGTGRFWGDVLTREVLNSAPIHDEA